MALLTASLPLTLPFETLPPPARIRLVSASLVGLWSVDKASYYPFVDKIVLESPKLAQNIYVGVIRTMVAQDPSEFSSPQRPLSSSSS